MSTPRPSGISRLLVGGVGVTRRVTCSGDCWTRRSVAMAAAAAASGTATQTAVMVRHPGLRSPGYHQSPVNRMRGQGRTQQRRTGRCRPRAPTKAARGGFDGRERRDLADGRPDQPYCGQALFAARGGDPGRHRYEDQDRESAGRQRRGPARPPETSTGVCGVGAVSMLRTADRTGLAGELAGAIADDDDQSVWCCQRAVADDADLVAGIPVAELVGRGRWPASAAMAGEA